MVELDLPLLELPLPGLQAYLVERLDGIWMFVWMSTAV